MITNVEERVIGGGDCDGGDGDCSGKIVVSWWRLKGSEKW